MGKKKNKPTDTAPQSPCMMSRLGMNPRAQVFYPRDHNATATHSTVATTAGSSARAKPIKGPDTPVKVVDEFQWANESVPSYIVDAVMKTGHKRERSDYGSPKTPTSTCSTMVSDASSATSYSAGVPTPKTDYESFRRRGTLGKAPRSSSGESQDRWQAKPPGRLLTAKEFDFSVLDKFYKDSADSGKYRGHLRGSSTSTHRSNGSA